MSRIADLVSKIVHEAFGFIDLWICTFTYVRNDDNSYLLCVGLKLPSHRISYDVAYLFDLRSQAGDDSNSIA